MLSLDFRGRGMSLESQADTLSIETYGYVSACLRVNKHQVNLHPTSLIRES